MEVAQHIAVIEREGKLFAAAARRSGLDAEVPSCPGWDVRDLVRHLAEIHLWAAARVAKRAPNLWPEDISEHVESWPDLAVFWPDDEELVDWYLETNANLVQVLEAAPPDLDCPTFLPAPSPLAMWARRQAHETAVHRFDAELAGDAGTGFEPEFAADGIDELLVAFAPRKTTLPVDHSSTMAVHATDTDSQWHVTLSPDGISTLKGEGPADVTLTGSASDLYLMVWNRVDEASVEIDGDRDVLDTWRGNHRVRWS